MTVTRIQSACARLESTFDESIFGELSQAWQQAVKQRSNSISFSSKGDYSYSDLIPGQKRVLSIQPGEGEDPVKCKLHLLDLSRPFRPYQALSYSWGEKLRPRDIILDGRPFHVGLNLYHALQRLRQSTQEVFLWVDDVCINQLREKEKIHQIHGMPAIYENATAVVVFLGEARDDSDYAMQLIKDISSGSFAGFTEERARRGLPALIRVMERDWFCRIWVLQEVAFVRNVRLICGKREVSFYDEFLPAIDYAWAYTYVRVKGFSCPEPTEADLEIHKTDRDFLKRLNSSRALTFFKALLKLIERDTETGVWRRRCALERVVTSLVSFQASKAQDIVLAVMSLANDTIVSNKHGEQADCILFKPKYEEQPSIYEEPSLPCQIYQQFIAHAINSGPRPSLDILCHPWSPLPRSLPEVKDLETSSATIGTRAPSFICPRSLLPYGDPVLCKRERVNADNLVGDVGRPQYNACGSTLPKVRFSGSLIMDVRGIVLGYVHELSRVAVRGVPPEGFIETLSDKNNNGPGQGASPCVWQTLCGNRRDEKGNPAPLEYSTASNELAPRRWCSQYNESDDKISKDAIAFKSRVSRVIWNRQAFRCHRQRNKLCDGDVRFSSEKYTPSSDDDLVGLAPPDARAGDLVCILLGLSVPVILREMRLRSGQVVCVLVGEAYAHGYMDGEAFSMSGIDDERVRFDEETFTLV